MTDSRHERSVFEGWPTRTARGASQSELAPSKAALSPGADRPRSMMLERVWDSARVARAAGARRVVKTAVFRLRAAIRRRRKAPPILSNRSVFGSQTQMSMSMSTSMLDAGRLGAALLAAPSPLAEGDDDARMRTLELDCPGARARIVDRAHALLCGSSQGDWRPSSTCGYDARLAWEAGRLGRLVAIAAGARVARTAAEGEMLLHNLEREVTSWLEANPPGSSAWSSPLEVAIRAWNLWVAVSFVRPWKLRQPVIRAVARSLAEHGRWLALNLEEHGLAVGSHLLGELLGLCVCGTALGTAGGATVGWREIGFEGLEKAAARQVLADGGGAEGSSGYARFVAELLVAALVTARAGRAKPLPTVLKAASAVLKWLVATMDPAGKDPAIGDDDGSVVLPPAIRSSANALPLAPFATVFGQSERLVGVPWSEECAWLAGAAGYSAYQSMRPRPWPSAWASPLFGLYLARSGGLGGDMVIVRAGPHGQDGVGGHAHNDALAVTVWLAGRPIVVDPGTGIYLGRPALRDRFRGVAAHATVCVDGLEPSPILSTRPFALPDRARARARFVEIDDATGVWRCSVCHDGYRRIGIACEREVVLDRPRARLEIVDRFRSCFRVKKSSVRRIVTSFPLAEGLDAEIIGGRVRARLGEATLWLEAKDDAESRWTLDAVSLSTRYGEVQRALCVRRSVLAKLPIVLITILTFDRRCDGEEPV
ncbi:MAG: alginate lyase family protein [Pseudomonadota bacterium]